MDEVENFKRTGQENKIGVESKLYVHVLTVNHSFPPFEKWLPFFLGVMC